MAEMRKWTLAATLRGSMVLLHVALVAATALPLPLLGPAAAAALVQPRAALPDFAAESAAMGLVASDNVTVESAGVTPDGRLVRLVTSAAAAPPGATATTLFFRRFSSYEIEVAGGLTIPLVESEMRVAEQNEHVTLEVIDRIAGVPDGAEAALVDLVGLEIHRRIELDFGGFAALEAAFTGPDAPSPDDLPTLLASMWTNGEVELGNFSHVVTVHYPDGRETTTDGESFDFGAILAEFGGDALTNGRTLYDCYADIGVDLTIFGAGCIVAGTVICAAACAVTAGVACIPCISGASLACGLGTAFGSLGYCLAKVIFGVDPPPTSTPVPTSTRTPTRTPTPAIPGDCDGDGRVSIGELISGVNIALGRTSLTACSSLDRDHDGRLSVSEIIFAVRLALVSA